MSCAKTAEPTEMQLGESREYILHGNIDASTAMVTSGVSSQLKSIVKHGILEVG